MTHDEIQNTAWIMFKNSLVSSFNDGELSNLCFEIGINDGSIPGNTIEEKSVQLIKYCKRHGHLKILLDRCKELRPNALWPKFSDLVESSPEKSKVDKSAVKNGGKDNSEETDPIKNVVSKSIILVFLAISILFFFLFLLNWEATIAIETTHGRYITAMDDQQDWLLKAEPAQENQGVFKLRCHL